MEYKNDPSKSWEERYKALEKYNLDNSLNWITKSPIRPAMYIVT